MKRTLRYARAVGTASCCLENGQILEIPVVPGIFKHAPPDSLEDLLRDARVARKYTIEALRIAPWQVLRDFPRAWLLECLEAAPLTAGRREALLFMLEAGSAPG